MTIKQINMRAITNKKNLPGHVSFSILVILLILCILLNHCIISIGK